MINLKDLLRHEILDLYSAEEQIIEALPKMVDKANNAELKKALSEHLRVTENQKNRLDEVKTLMGEEQEFEGSENKKGFFSRLFGGSGGEKCKGTEGLIKEGEKMMGEDMTPEAMDAAIIGGAQKIEHYEICGYGTAAAYARELGLSNIAGLLQQTLNEEYFADDLLTQLAVGKLNIKAENATEQSGSSKSKKGEPSKSGTSKGSPSKGNASSKSVSKSSASKASASKTSVSKASTSKASAQKGNTSKGNTSKSSKFSGNKSTSKSAPKSSGKSGGGTSSKGGAGKSGKSKASGGRKR